MKYSLITTAAVVAGAMMLAPWPEPVQAETCYQDAKGRISQRRRPGYKRIECPVERSEAATPKKAKKAGSATAGRLPEAVPEKPAGFATAGRPPRKHNPASPIPRPVLADFPDSIPVPDRWRIVDTLGYKQDLLDPYNRNVLKADRPIHDDWFFNLGVISDTVVEQRNLPTGVGSSSADSNRSVDIFGDSDQSVFVKSVAVEFVYYKGDTVFRPPDHEFRFIPVFNYNRVELEEIQGVNADPENGKTRNDSHVGIQAAFYDRHLRNVSDHYDFDSIRFGIQPFSSDFRGFLFQDSPLGVRLFGNRDNNVFQYNLAWFRRIEKDTNSGLNDLGADLRDDDVFVANLYWQDLFVKGFTSQFSIIHNRNGENGEPYFNHNDFIERPASLGREQPREYQVTYLGYSGDGHIGRVNLSTSLYYAFGSESPSVFVDADTDISAFFAAAELSMDFDWIRPRISFLYGSGDEDPFDDKATGFDAIFENPQFAGADSSYWIRQAVPLVGGGRVALSGRNGVLNSLRSSKEEGQSNFINPGIVLLGVGADFDILPELRLSLNANDLYFDDSAVVETARNQAGIDEHIGLDVSAALVYRPYMSQNIVLRASWSKLFAGDGFKALYPDDDPSYLLFNAILAY
jgi:hypothetical protein